MQHRGMHSPTSERGRLVTVHPIMSKRKIRKLYARAVDAYRQGVVRAGQGDSISKPRSFCTPMDRAEYRGWLDGNARRVDPHRNLPLDVWVLVLADSLAGTN